MNHYKDNLDLLPESLETLILGYRYKIPINDLPSSVKEIYKTQNSNIVINKIYEHKVKLYDVNNRPIWNGEKYFDY